MKVKGCVRSKRKSKKRVRIVPGHQSKSINTARAKSSIRKSQANMGTSVSSRVGRLSISELVYRFLERASSRGVDSGQKTNAANQFRKLQRRKRTRRPENLPHLGNRRSPSGSRARMRKKFRPDPAQPLEKKEPAPSAKASGVDVENEDVKKCMNEILSYGALYGLVVPVDGEGGVYRVKSNLDLKIGVKPKPQSPKESDDEEMQEE